LYVRLWCVGGALCKWYSVCKCSKEPDCPFTFKVYYCQKSSHSEILGGRLHQPEHGRRDIERKPIRGVATCIRIKQYCKEDADLTEYVNYRKKSIKDL